MAPGYILGIDPSDGLAKFYIGNSSSYFNWTGTEVVIAGSITASSINIPNSTAPLFSVSSAGVLTAQGIVSVSMKAYTDFETIARFIKSTGGTGTAVFGVTGAQLDTTNGGTGFAKLLWAFSGGANDVASLNLKFYASFSSNTTLAANGSMYIGVGIETVSATGHTFTGNHVGFKMINSLTGLSLIATQAASGTETTSALATVPTGSGAVDVFLVVNAASVDYYYRILSNTAVPSFTKVTISTAPPTTITEGIAQISMSSDNNTPVLDLQVATMGVER